MNFICMSSILCASPSVRSAITRTRSWQQKHKIFLRNENLICYLYFVFQHLVIWYMHTHTNTQDIRKIDVEAFLL